MAELDAPEPRAPAILAKRARVDGVQVDPEALAEIARRVTTSVRALEGALIRVVAYASLKEELPTQELAREVLAGSGADTGTDTMSHR